MSRVSASVSEIHTLTSRAKQIARGQHGHLGNPRNTRRQTSKNAESLWAPSTKAAALRTVFQAVLLTAQLECQQAVPRAGLRAPREQASSQQELPQRLKRQTAPMTPLPLPPWHYLWPPSGFPDIAPTVCRGLACQGCLHGTSRYVSFKNALPPERQKQGGARSEEARAPGACIAHANAHVDVSS